MSVLDATTLDLGKTATQSLREATWFPGEESGCGTLVMLIQGRKTEHFVYGVQEEPAPERGVRSWLVENPDGTEDTYRVQCGPRGDRCWCKAGRCGLACKHLAFFRMAMAEGVI